MKLKNTKYTETEIFETFLDLEREGCENEEYFNFIKTGAENLIKQLRRNRK